MKKIVIILCFLSLLMQSYAQRKRLLTHKSITTAAVTTCAGTAEMPLPYSPSFGIANDTAAEIKQWSFAPYNREWQFQTIPSEGTAIVPHFSNRNPSEPATRSIFSRCISLDGTKKYELKFTFVGTSEGVTHDLNIYLSTDSTYSDTLWVGSFNALPYGTTSCAFVLDSIPETGGDFRIAFMGSNIAKSSSFYLKDIFFHEVSLEQLDIISLNTPLSKCDLSEQTVSFNIKNSGVQTPDSFQICYQYNTGEGTSFSALVCKTFTINIPYNEIRTVSFPTRQTFNADVTVLNAWISSGQNVFDSLQNVAIYKTTPRQVPYTCAFDDYSTFRDWVIIPKTTQSDVTWHVPLDSNRTMTGEAVITTSGVASDDRLVSGCIVLQKDTLYKVSFTYKANATTHFENLRLYVGTNNLPQASDSTLMDIQEFNNTDFRTISAYFKPSSSGSCFFGFLAYSQASSGGITVSDFSITKTTPAQTPVYMGFEDYDESEGWQMFSHNSITEAWQKSAFSIDRFSGSMALKTLSATAPNINDNWLISKPLALEADKTYEILYFRKATSSPATEILNVRMDHRSDIQLLSLSTPLFQDSVTSTSYTAQKLYFRPASTGIYYLSFQYNSEIGRISMVGLCLDDIAIRDSATTSDTNVNVVELTIPDPSCKLNNSQKATLIIKNRSPYSIPNSRLTAYFSLNGTTQTSINVPTIQAYQSISVESGNLRMNTVNTYTVKAWISGTIDKNKSDDTSAIKQTEKIEPISGEYRMGFEPNEIKEYWSINKTSESVSDEWWNFTENSQLAHAGEGLAYLKPVGFLSDSVKQYIVSPCLDLSRDTTYFISFFYRANKVSTTQNTTNLNIYAGTNGSNLATQFKKGIPVTNSAYKRTHIHFRPSNLDVQYVIIEGVTNSYSNGICLDDFIVMDSAAASLPNIAINQLWATSSYKCDLSSPDTLYVEVANNGFFPYENPTFKLHFGDQTIEETYTGIIPNDTAVVIKLTNVFEYSDYGENSIRITLVVPDNRAQTDTSSLIKTAKYPPVGLPYSTTFKSDEILPWNNLPETFNYSHSKTFEYWQFDSVSPSETYAFFANGPSKTKPGLLVSRCLSVVANEPYLVTYQYKTASTLKTENLHVLHEKIDGTTTKISTQSALNNTAYQSNAVTFYASGTGNERIWFNSDNSLSAEGIYINYVSIKPDTASWPADVKLIRILSPITDTALSATEPVTVTVTNINRRPLTNIPMFYTLDGTLYTDTIQTLNPGDTVQFTFNPKAGLTAYKTYELAVFTNVREDVARSNDTLRSEVTCIAPPVSNNKPSMDESTPLTIYPNPATTEVFVKSAKDMSTLSIYDMKGQLFNEIRVNSKEYRLNTTNLPAGLYIISCQIGDERISKRIVIKTSQP